MNRKAPRSRHLCTTVAEEAIRASQQQFTTTLDGLTRQNVDLQAELAQSRQQAASELAALRQEVRAPQRGRGRTAAGKAGRLLGCSRRVARLECSVRELRWRSGATTAEADGGSRESRNADPKRHDPGGRRSGCVGTALPDDAHDLQGSSSEHRVPGRRQRRCRLKATTDEKKKEPKMRTLLRDN